MVESINTIFKGKHTFQPVVFGNLVETFNLILNSFHITENKTDLNLHLLLTLLQNYYSQNGQSLCNALQEHIIWQNEDVWR